MSTNTSTSIVGQVFSSTITRIVKGGLIVKLGENGPEAYLHVSELAGKDRSARDTTLASLAVGEAVTVKVVSDKEEAGKTRYRVSQFAVIRDERKAKQALSSARINELARGSSVEGSIAHVNTEKNFAIVDLGCETSGVLHVSQVNGRAPVERDRRFAKLAVGDKVRVAVIETSEDNGRVRLRLSERRATFNAAVGNLVPGHKISGTVVGWYHGNIVVAVGGAEGHLPETELGNSKLESINKRGNTVKVTVVEIDHERCVVRLSRKS